MKTRQILTVLAAVILVFSTSFSRAQSRPAGSVEIVNVASTPATALTADTVIAASTGTLTLTAQPDCARNVLLAFTDGNGSIPTVKVTIYGKNQFGYDVTETLVKKTTGSLVTTGSVTFASIASIAWSGASGWTSTSDKVQARMGDSVGFPIPIAAAGDLYKVQRATVLATPVNQTIVAANVSVLYCSYKLPANQSSATTQWTFWARPSITRVQEPSAGATLTK